MLRDVSWYWIASLVAAPWLAQAGINKFGEAWNFLRAVWRLPAKAMLVCSAVAIALSAAFTRTTAELILFSAVEVLVVAVVSVAHSHVMLRKHFGDGAYRWARQEYRAGRAVTLEQMRNHATGDA